MSGDHNMYQKGHMTTQSKAERLADALERRGYVSLTMSTRIVDKEVAAELRRLHQSEREGWRYADELEQERKALQQMLNQERTESEARLTEAERVMKLAMEALEDYEPNEAHKAIAALRERLARCDDCGKPLGIDGHIHTCSPKTRTITYICPVCAASLERQE